MLDLKANMKVITHEEKGEKHESRPRNIHLVVLSDIPFHTHLVV